MRSELGRATVAASHARCGDQACVVTPSHALAWRYPCLYDLYFSLSPLASRLRSREMRAVLTASNGLMEKTDRVIEIGCGPGTYTMPIAAGCRHLVALDSSPAMLGRLSERIAARGVHNVDVRWGRLPDRLGEGAFDGLLAAGVLDYMADLERALAAVRAAVRPGGWMVLTVPLARSAARPAWALEGVVRRRAYARRADEVVNAAVAAGLEIRGMESVGLARRGRTLVMRAVRRPSDGSCPRCSKLPPP